MYEGFILRQQLKDEKNKEARIERIEAIEAEIFEHTSGIAQAYLDFHQVHPHQTEPPPEWVEQFGEVGAKQRLAVAKAGWLPQAAAPSAVTQAFRFLFASGKARRHNVRVQASNLNVTIALPPPTTREHPGPVEYEVRDLEE